MSKEIKHIPLWPFLIELVTERILLAIMYVCYAITAESYYLLDHKNWAIHSVCAVCNW